MATYSINDYYVYNKATGELEPYPQVAAQPGFNVNAEVLFDPAGNKYVGSELQAAINANRGGGGLFGGISNAVTNVFQPAEKIINQAAVDLDNTVNQNIPGGWGTVAAVVAAVATGGASLAGDATVAAGAGAADLAAYDAIAGLTAGGAGTAAGVGAAGAGGYTAAELLAAEGAVGASAAENLALTNAVNASAAGAPAVSGTGFVPNNRASMIGEGLKPPVAPNVSDGFFSSSGTGGGQGLVANTATIPKVGALDVGYTGMTGVDALGVPLEGVSVSVPQNISAAGITSGGLPVLPMETRLAALDASVAKQMGLTEAALAKAAYDETKSNETTKAPTTTATADTKVDRTPAFMEALRLLLERRKENIARKTYAEGGAVVEPTKPTKTDATAVTTGTTDTKLYPGKTDAGVVTAGTSTAKDVTATGVTAPTKVSATSITADTAQSKVETALNKVAAEQGTVSDKAQAAAVSMKPEDTALSGVQAAQGVATKVVAPADRKLETGELVTGSAVDMAKVEDTLAKAKAAEGTVTEEMTTQGQLNKLLTDFDAKAPPPWASASIRAVTAQLAARGLGASSLAGQAVIQATLEAGLPIAQADAKVFENMGLVNLSNRQQTAILVAQQRADFLKQDFDDNFKAKVLNAAKISDIANKNFDAATTIALENARLVGSMDIANLSARNAVVLAKAAQMANLETTNLNNRQLVAVENSKAFLAMDLKNLDNKQQTNLFKAKEVADSIVSDTAQANAIKATNATNALDAEKINASLALTAAQYNAAELNKVAIFNKTASDEMVRFNAQESNDRAEFNAAMTQQINIANAKLLADISTANTREENAIAAVNAKNATDLAASTYAQLSQTYRDQIEQAWKTTDNSNDRANKISVATLQATAETKAAEFNADAAFSAAIGQLSVSMLAGGGGTVVAESMKTAFDEFKRLFTG